MEINDMAYNETIAKITGQALNAHSILYDMHNRKYAIYKIIGNKGTGKKTLCDHIAHSWLAQNRGKVFYLNASYQKTLEDYAVFKNLGIRTEKERIFLNIFKEVLKDVPYVGNSLSAIASGIIKATDERDPLEKDYTQNEKYIFRTINNLSQNKDVLFLCYDFESWDLKSQQVLSGFAKYIKNNSNGKKVYFLFTFLHKEKKVSNLNVTEKYLNEIHEEDLNEIVKQFNADICLENEQQKQLYELTNGNLELIKESLELFERNSIQISSNFYDIIKTHIENNSDKAEKTLELLKQAAFIGEQMDSCLLRIFSEADSDLYEQLLSEAIRLCYLKEEEYTLSFIKKYVYSVIKDCLFKERKYYLRLFRCINVLYPSKYDLQFFYLYRGDLLQQADKIFFIYLISYYRENSVLYELSNRDKARLMKNSLYPLYEQLCYCYQLYKNKKYDEAEDTLINLDCNFIEFRFEKDYLLSLIVTNKYYTLEEFLERIDVMESYDTEEFQLDFPEMYLRALMMLAEFYSETSKENELRSCLKKINKCFSKYVATDKQMRCYEHCFKLKANAFYKIEIATKYTEDAFKYFDILENRQMYLSKYYLSILNYSANKIVLGFYEEAYELLLKANDIIQRNPHLQIIHEDILINNLAISGYLGNFYSAQECADALENIISRVSENADNVLLQNNRATFLAMAGKFDEAICICDSLYNKIAYNDDIDEYYRYYILNNYGILLWIVHQEDNALQVLTEAFELKPLPRDNAYFKARSNMILSLVKSVSVDTIINVSDWNMYLYNQNPAIVGPAWKFWSSLLLFSELQIWSDY